MFGRLKNMFIPFSVYSLHEYFLSGIYLVLLLLPP